MAKLKDCLYDGSSKFKLDEYPTNAKVKKAKREKVGAKMAANKERMAQLQDMPYAQGKEVVRVHGL